MGVIGMFAVGAVVDVNGARELVALIWVDLYFFFIIVQYDSNSSWCVGSYGDTCVHIYERDHAGPMGLCCPTFLS